MSETVLVLDFGSQYTQLIARRIREQRVYSVVLPFDSTIDKLRALNPKAIIFSGGPQSVYAEAAPQEQALKITGLRAVFGEKYPPMVRVVLAP